MLLLPCQCHHATLGDFGLGVPGCGMRHGVRQLHPRQEGPDTPDPRQEGSISA